MFGWLRNKAKGARQQGADFADSLQYASQMTSHGHAINALSQKVDLLLREQRAVLRRLSLPPVGLWRGQPAQMAAVPQSWGVFPYSTLCRQESFEAPYFSYWTQRLAMVLNYHRKTWEFVFIGQSLEERGVLVPGARGLGFGVGQETLPAYLASIGCQIVGTDMAADLAETAGWIATSEHAAGREAMRRSEICPDAVFDAAVAFRTCDMNAIPADLTGFDFCWSACALEHLGSIELGLRFILNSVDCLKPGGWAIHTTEFNLDSNDDTVDNGGTVLFRRRDFEDLAVRLAEKGCELAPFDYNPGHGPIDRYVDLPPYLVEPHLKLALEGYAATSVGLIIHKKA